MIIIVMIVNAMGGEEVVREARGYGVHLVQELEHKVQQCNNGVTVVYDGVTKVLQWCYLVQELEHQVQLLVLVNHVLCVCVCVCVCVYV
jgi:hypothetical protein